MNNIDYLKKYLNEDDIENGIDKLNKGISPQYIVGNVNFYGNIINVDNRVLIPRFETELLVEKTINYINKLFDKKVNILDLCTGSCCIAISIKKLIDCDMDASDISDDALEVAAENIKLNDVKINLINSDILTNINKRYDVIISNPPYISFDEDIEDMVKNNEPSIALYASNNGLYFYDKILNDCKKNLNNRFLIAFEIGYKQGNDIKNMVYKYFGSEVNISVEKDYSERDRFIFIWK
ncbi:MAG: peptide chain release factor N(5)-glutamine methyltransferase [Bacilli bacterium]|nr:peptide chain release factor N(5)-glutamine methyltransferase [Bacilli bacterium]